MKLTAQFDLRGVSGLFPFLQSSSLFLFCLFCFAVRPFFSPIELCGECMLAPRYTRAPVHRKFDVDEKGVGKREGVNQGKGVVWVTGR